MSLSASIAPDREGERRARSHPMPVRHASRLRRGALIALCALLPSLAVAADQEPPFAGPPYTGKVTLNIVLPDGKVHTQHGDAEARWERRSPDRVYFMFRTKPTEKGSTTEMEVEGNYTEGGWQAVPGHVRLAVTPDGAIRGDGLDKAGHRRFAFNGEVTATQLTFEHQLSIDAEQGGVPAGTTITYRYDLQRPAMGMAANAAAR